MGGGRWRRLRLPDFSLLYFPNRSLNNSIIHSSSTTSLNFWSMSNNPESCTAACRSPHACLTTNGQKPFCVASTAFCQQQFQTSFLQCISMHSQVVVLTHPLVEYPHMIFVSTPKLTSKLARLVPKKLLLYCLYTTTSSSLGTIPSANTRIGFPSS
jgi:hypothetical protein